MFFVMLELYMIYVLLEYFINAQWRNLYEGDSCTAVIAMFIPPIPIWAWGINLSENWLNGICDHALENDHMGSELNANNLF